MSQDSPYDFFSVTHYNSDALQRNRHDLTILSKTPALVNDKNEIFFERNFLSNIDKIQIQRLYKCKEIEMPNIVKMKSFADEAKVQKLRDRFEIETSFESYDKNIVDKYLQRTIRTCGMNHFWPSEYPLVDQDHELYKLVCIKKRDIGERCRFSLECMNEEAVCIRIFFKRSGRCFKTDNQKINKYSQNVNDKLFKAGKKVKDKVKDSISSLKKFSKQYLHSVLKRNEAFF